MEKAGRRRRSVATIRVFSRLEAHHRGSHYAVMPVKGGPSARLSAQPTQRCTRFSDDGL